MPGVGLEADKNTVQGFAMEISVSKQELLRELTATQSVVERKTTIPILSNFLLEADEAEAGSPSPPPISIRPSRPPAPPR